MNVLLIKRFNEAPMSIIVLATLCRPIGILTTNGKFLSNSSVIGWSSSPNEISTSGNAGRLFCYDQVRCFSPLLRQKSEGRAIGRHPLDGLHDSLHTYGIKIRIQVLNQSCTRSSGV
jgi:hypothetical protein